MTIIGREKETYLIRKCYESSENEFVALYGRRRVGKTYLMCNSFDNNFDFKFTASYHSTTAMLLEKFQLEINKKTNKNVQTPKNWGIALDNLKEYLISLKKDKVLIFIDELPWMDTYASKFINYFSTFVNTWDVDKCLMKLFVCGSATSWMINNLIGDKGGLHGRTTRQIHLSPFTLKETEEYFKEIKGVSLSKKQVLDLYMIVGGVPYYLNMFDFNESIIKNIDDLFFDSNGPLRSEFKFLFESLFKQSENYRKVICALSTRLYGITRDELSSIVKINGGYLTEILDNLRKCDFIHSYSSIDKKTKGAIYQLIDLYSLFYLRFVDDNDGQDPKYWTHIYNSNVVSSWRGYAFEQVCLIHSEQIKKALGINGILSNIYSWKEKAYIDKNGNKWNGGQIDLIIDRKDDFINACEIKYSNDKYIITKEYESKVRDRISSFVNSTKTKKNVINTFITTYGVSNSDIVDNEIKFESLFE